MATYELQETKRAHGPMEDSDKDGFFGDSFETVSVHRTLSAAVKELLRHRADMRSYCGGSAWSHHHQIVGASQQEIDDEIFKIENRLALFPARMRSISRSK